MRLPLPVASLVTALLLAAAASGASAQSVPPQVSGTVRDAATGAPVAGALVILVGRYGDDRVQTRSDSAGSFRVAAPRPGVYSFTVLSDDPAGAETMGIQLAAGDQLVLNVRLGAALYALEPITISVSGDDPVTERVRTFRERAEFNKALGRGRIFTREDVEAIRPRSAAALLGTIPLSRCDPQLRLDGLPTTVGDLRTVPAGALEGMEVYMGTDVPREFEDRGACGVVLVWTRGRPEGMRDMSVMYVLVSALLSAAAFLAMR